MTMIRITSLIFALLVSWSACAQVPLTGAGKGAPGGGGTPMVTPLLGVNISVPSNSATNFNSLVSGSDSGSAWQALIGAANTPVAIFGSLSNLVVNGPTTIVSGSYALTIVKNGTPTALTCTLSSGAQICTDTIDTVSVSPGDLIAIQSVPTGTPAAQNNMEVSLLLTSSAAGESVVYAGNTTNASSNLVQNYFGWQGSTLPTATENVASILVPTSGVIDQFYAATRVAPGAAKTWQLTLFKNGIATSLTCQIAGASATSCNDTNAGHAVSVAATDLISLQTDPGGTTPANTAMQFTARWVPTISGESFVATQARNLPPTSGTSVYELLGSQNFAHGEATILSIAPSSGIKLKKLFVSQDVAPGGATTRAVNLRKGTGGGQTSQALTCTITSAATSCSDTTNSYTTTLNDFLNWQVVETGTLAAVTLFKTSAVLCTGGSC